MNNESARRGQLALAALPGVNHMEIYELKNKILEVLAYARVVSIRNGHTGEYAKHVVALVVKQTMHFTDNEITEFLSTN